MTDLKEERLKDSDLKRQAMSGFWRRFLERFGAQGVILVVSIVLARMLDPQVYGMVAIVTIFTALLNVFADSGLGSALIHKRDADEMYFSTVFFFNVFRSVVLYLNFFLSPLIAGFYHMPELNTVLRVMSITVIIYNVINVQQANVSKKLRLRHFFMARADGAQRRRAARVVKAQEL